MEWNEWAGNTIRRKDAIFYGRIMGVNSSQYTLHSICFSECTRAVPCQENVHLKHRDTATAIPRYLKTLS